MVRFRSWFIGEETIHVYHARGQEKVINLIVGELIPQILNPAQNLEAILSPSQNLEERFENVLYNLPRVLQHFWRLLSPVIKDLVAGLRNHREKKE